MTASQAATSERCGGECTACRLLEERGVAVLVCGACYSARRGVRLSKLFLAKRLMARNRRASVSPKAAQVLSS